MCLNTGTPKTINFPFVPNGKLMVLGVPIFKHFRVFKMYRYTHFSAIFTKVDNFVTTCLHPCATEALGKTGQLFN